MAIVVECPQCKTAVPLILLLLLLYSYAGLAQTAGAPPDLYAQTNLWQGNLRSSSSTVRDVSINQLGLLALRAQPEDVQLTHNVLAVLAVVMLGDPDPYVRASAVDVVTELTDGKLSGNTETLARTFEVVLVAARDPDAVVRSSAIRWLGTKQDERARDPVKAALSDPNASVRIAAIRSVAVTRDGDSLSQLQKDANRDALEQLEVINTLWCAGSADAAPAVGAALKAGGDPRVVMAAIGALVQFGGTDAQEALKRFADADGADADCRAAASAALTQISESKRERTLAAVARDAAAQYEQIIASEREKALAQEKASSASAANTVGSIFPDAKACIRAYAEAMARADELRWRAMRLEVALPPANSISDSASKATAASPEQIAGAIQASGVAAYDAKAIACILHAMARFGPEATAAAARDLLRARDGQIQEFIHLSQLRRQAVIVLAERFKQHEPISTAFAEENEDGKWELVKTLYRVSPNEKDGISLFVFESIAKRFGNYGVLDSDAMLARIRSLAKSMQKDDAETLLVPLQQWRGWQKQRLKNGTFVTGSDEKTLKDIELLIEEISRT